MDVDLDMHSNDVSVEVKRLLNNPKMVKRVFSRTLQKSDFFMKFEKKKHSMVLHSYVHQLFGSELNLNVYFCN